MRDPLTRLRHDVREVPSQVVERLPQVHHAVDVALVAEGRVNAVYIAVAGHVTEVEGAEVDGDLKEEEEKQWMELQ